MKTATRPVAGDLIEIPMAGADRAYGKIVYASRHFKRLLLVGVFQTSGFPTPSPQAPPSEFAILTYTASQALEGGRWRKVGHAPLTTSEGALSLRTVAGDVYLGDDRLRKATSKDLSALPEQLVAGIFLFEKKVARALQMQPPPKEPFSPTPL